MIINDNANKDIKLLLLIIIIMLLSRELLLEVEGREDALLDLLQVGHDLAD